MNKNLTKEWNTVLIITNSQSNLPRRDPNATYLLFGEQETMLIPLTLLGIFSSDI